MHPCPGGAVPTVRWSLELARVTREGWPRSPERAGRSAVGCGAKETALYPWRTSLLQKEFLLPVGWVFPSWLFAVFKSVSSVPGHVVVVLMSVLVWVWTPEQKLGAMAETSVTLSFPICIRLLLTMETSSDLHVKSFPPVLPLYPTC